MRFFHDKSDLRGSNSDGTLHLSTDSDFFNMPKKKTGQRKKAEKQRERQKELRNAEKSLAQQPSNFLMVCEYVNVSYMCLFRISSYIVHVVYTYCILKLLMYWKILILSFTKMCIYLNEIYAYVHIFT